MGDSNHETSPLVQRAMQKFHDKMNEHEAKKKLSTDADLSVDLCELTDRVRKLIDERDHLLHIATEMLATLLNERNNAFVSRELRQVADVGWRPQIEAVAAGRNLTPEELNAALAMSGIDMQKGYERLREAIAKYKPKVTP